MATTRSGKIPRHYIPYDPNQTFLLPLDMSHWLPANHMVYFLLHLLQEIDLSAFERSATSYRGRPSYHYQMLVGLLLYAYSQGVTSSRLIERKTFEEIPYCILAGNLHPDHNTIANFRKHYLQEFASVSAALLLKLHQAKYLSLDLVSLDGTKLKANASIHRNLTIESALKQREQVQQWIQTKLQEAEQQDREEDSQYKDQNPYLGLPSGSYANKTVEELIQEVNQLDHFLDQSKTEYTKKHKQEQTDKAQERQAKERAETGSVSEKPTTDQSSPMNPPNRKHQSSASKKRRNHQRIKASPVKLPPPEYVCNRTDPESRIMKAGSNHAWVQAFNVEVAVDSDHQFIVGSSVTQDCNDQHQLVPMIKKLKKQFQITPKQLVADAGYCSEKNLTALLKHQIDGYIATGRPEWMHHNKKKETEQAEKTKPTNPSLSDQLDSGSGSDSDLSSAVSTAQTILQSSTLCASAAESSAPKENGYTHRLGYSLVETMKLKLKTQPGKEIYKKRGNLSESPFGFIRRAMKFTQFSLRGLKQVQGEANLLLLAYNLRKYYQLSHPVSVTPRKLHSYMPSTG